MNILYDGQVFSFQDYGGISRYYFEIIRHLLPLKDVAPNLLVRYSNNIFLKNLPIQDIRPLFPSRRIKGKFELLKFLNRRFVQKNFLRYGTPDIFHPTYYDPYFLRFIGDIPFVVTVYDMVHELYPDQFHPIDYSAKNKRIVTSRANRIIAISENTKKDLVRLFHLSPEKIDVIPLAAGLSPDFQQKPSLQFPENYFLYVGKRNTYKNFNVLLNAMRGMKETISTCYLICAGGGALSASERQQIQTLGLDGSIMQMEVSDSQLAYLYSHAKALVYPSQYEGFGIPILEAFVCGCPAIASNSSSLPEVGGSAALYFHPSDVSTLTAILSEVWTKQGLADDLRARGRERARLFSWEQTARKTLDTYDKIIHEGITKFE